MKYGVKMTAYLPDGMPYYEGVAEVFDNREDAQKRLIRSLNHPHPDHVEYRVVQGENLAYYSKRYIEYPRVS